MVAFQSTYSLHFTPNNSNSSIHFPEKCQVHKFWGFIKNLGPHRLLKKSTSPRVVEKSMSQNVWNSHNPLYITWILPPPLLPPKKKRYLIKTSRNILCIGPGAQTSNFPNPTKSPRLSRLLGPDLLPSSMRSSPCAPNSFNHDLSDRGKHPDDVQALSFFLLWQKNMADLCWMILFPYKNDSQIFFKFRYCWYMSEFFLKITWGFWCKNAEKLQVFKTVARLRAGPKSLFWSKALFGTIPRPAEMQVLKRKLVWCLNFSTKLKTMRTVKLDRFPRPDGRQEKDNQRGGCEASQPRRTEDSMGWTPNSKLFGVIFESLETTTTKGKIWSFYLSFLSKNSPLWASPIFCIASKWQTA